MGNKAKEEPLPKGYYVFTDARGKERLQYKCTINKKRHTYSSCQYDPRKNPYEAYEEIQKWKHMVMNPDEDTRLKLPSFVKKFTLNDTFAYALNQYVLFYKNVDDKRRERRDRLIRPAKETVRVLKDTIKLIEKYDLGQLKVRELNEHDIQEFIFDLADKYTYTRKGVEYHYGETTCNKVYGLIKSFCKDMGWEKVLFSDVKKAVLSDKKVYRIKSDIPEENIMSEEEASRFKTALFETYSTGRRILGVDTSDAIYVMLDAALRPAEIRGVKKKDFRESDKSIFIRYSIPKGERKEVKGIKNEFNDRVFLTDKAAEIVKEHIKSCISDEDFIFKTKGGQKDGYPLDPKNSTIHIPLAYRSLYCAVKRAAKRAKIDEKSIYPYLARHTTVDDVYINDGPAAAQMVARHRQLTTTERYYVHATRELAIQSRNRRNSMQQ